MPTAHVWLDMARLVTGEDGMPPCVPVHCLHPCVSARHHPFPCGAVVLQACAAVLRAVRSVVMLDVAVVRRCAAAHPALAPLRRLNCNRASCWSGSVSCLLRASLRATFKQGIMVSPVFTVSRCLGAVVQIVWRRYWPETYSSLLLQCASGLVLGEGIMAIVNALCTAAGLGPWTCAGIAPGQVQGC